MKKKGLIAANPLPSRQHKNITLEDAARQAIKVLGGIAVNEIYDAIGDQEFFAGVEKLWDVAADLERGLANQEGRLPWWEV